MFPLRYVKANENEDGATKVIWNMFSARIFLRVA